MKKIIPVIVSIILLTSCQSMRTEDTDSVSGILSSMTLREKVWQMMITEPEGIIDIGTATVAGEKTKMAIEQYPVGGFVFFSKNIETRGQITDMIAGMQSYSKIPLFIAVDEEGGRVSRLGKADIGVMEFPPMAQIGASGDASKAAEVGDTFGRELSELGFNVDFAPVADIITVGDNEDIGDRSFGTDPYLTARMVSEEVRAMQQYNVCAVLKHFPGGGSTSADTHSTLGITERTLDELRSAEFIPFKAGIDAGADMVMAAHIAAADIDGETPASMSGKILDILRGELGFEGVIVTDALNMGAITERYTSGEAAVASVKAGADILLMPTDANEAAEAMIEAVQNDEISEERIDESVVRILKLKLKRGIIE